MNEEMFEKIAEEAYSDEMNKIANKITSAYKATTNYVREAAKSHIKKIKGIANIKADVANLRKGLSNAKARSNQSSGFVEQWKKKGLAKGNKYHYSDEIDAFSKARDKVKAMAQKTKKDFAIKQVKSVANLAPEALVLSGGAYGANKLLGGRKK